MKQPAASFFKNINSCFPDQGMWTITATNLLKKDLTYSSVFLKPIFFGFLLARRHLLFPKGLFTLLLTEPKSIFLKDYRRKDDPALLLFLRSLGRIPEG